MRTLAALAFLVCGTTVSVAAPVVDVIAINQDSSVKSSVPVTFGHVFKEGDVNSGDIIGAELDDGTAIELQVDKKASHNDGSVRHAILTARIPSLQSFESRVIKLNNTGSTPPGSAVSLSALNSTSFDATVDVSVGGVTYSAAAMDLLNSGTPTTWLQGPLVSEWLVGAPLKTPGGVEHPHLTAYFHVRAYAGSPINRVRVDVSIENNWTYVSGPSDFGYSVTVKVGGNSVYTSSMTHYDHARWHKQFWWGAAPGVYIKHDKYYLQATKAIPQYEDITPTESFLNSVRSSTPPMDNGDHRDNMQDTGFQAGIGPLPRWDAVYAISTDKRAFDYMLANADGGSAYGIHYRDKLTGYPVSLDDYPDISLADPNASSNPVPMTGSANPYYEGNWSSHQPSMGFLPYIVTGDYFYLEEAQFWTAFTLIWPSPVGRNYAAGWFYNQSLRGQAWAYRSLAQVAYITPDNHPMKAYFLSKLQSNIDRDTSLYVTPGGPHKNNLGAMYMAEGNEQYRFYEYFMSWAVQYLVDLGFTQAIPFRDYKLQFPIGLMGINNGEYCFQLAARYTWKVGPGGTSTFYNNFGEVFANSEPNAANSGLTCGSQAMANFLGVALNEMNGGQDSTTYYFANLQPALAAAYDSGLPGGTDAWARAMLSGIHPDYRDLPNWAVVPRGLSNANLTFFASPHSVSAGSTTTLSWATTGVNSCSASGNWSGSKSLSGNQQVGPISSDTTYTLNCSGDNGNVTKTVVVTVDSGGGSGGGDGGSGGGDGGSGGGDGGSGGGDGGSGGGSGGGTGDSNTNSELTASSGAFDLFLLLVMALLVINRAYWHNRTYNS